MDYIELVCNLHPNTQENRGFISAKLDMLSYESSMITENGLNAYIPADNFDLEKVLKLKSEVANFKIKISYSRIADQNWNETWEQNSFKPIFVGKKLLVRASFHKNLPTDMYREIVIDPKTAFGTGYHATTYNILEEIVDLKLRDKRILDMGTGTGIFAILSKMKKSAYTLAVDNDERAIVNTYENIELNNVSEIKIKIGTTAILTNEVFDIIYENIWKNTVIADLPILKKHIAKDGIILLSGFYEKDIDDVKKAGEKVGLNFAYSKVKDGWAMVKFLNE